MSKEVNKIWSNGDYGDLCLAYFGVRPGYRHCPSVRAGVASDVFFFANRIPNYLRRLFADGAFNQAFVPVATEYKAKGIRSR